MYIFYCSNLCTLIVYVATCSYIRNTCKMLILKLKYLNSDYVRFFINKGDYHQ